MSTFRSRRAASVASGSEVRPGGVATDAGASGRTDPISRITRPAYRTSQGVTQPTGGQGGPASHPLLDLSTVSGWRTVFVLAALAYVAGFHITLGRFRVGAGPGARIAL